MALWDFIKTELIDIVEWLDATGDTMVYRFERHENEIKNGAQLIVRPGQAAVFVDQGQIADVFEPGRYELKTENLPILSTIRGWKYGFNSPFKADVYYLNNEDAKSGPTISIGGPGMNALLPLWNWLGPDLIAEILISAAAVAWAAAGLIDGRGLGEETVMGYYGEHVLPALGVAGMGS